MGELTKQDPTPTGTPALVAPPPQEGPDQRRLERDAQMLNELLSLPPEATGGYRVAQ